MSENPDDGGRDRASRLPLMFGARGGGISVATLLGLTGALFVWQSSLLDLGHVGLPGPGFFPLVLAVSVIVLAIAIGLDSWLSRTKDERIALLHRDVLIVMAASLAVPLVFVDLGALATLFVFAAAILVFVTRVRLLTAVASAAAFVTACWILFQALLGLQLPMGPF
jgi:hypothetical protein